MSIKRKLGMTIALTLTAASLAACSGGGNTTTAATTTAATTQGTTASQSAEATGYTFTYKGVTMGMNTDASVIDGLGDYKEKTETPSCAFEGNDNQYYYGSFYLCTGSDGDNEVITSIWFADDTVETDEGVCIGDSSEKVAEIYGEDGFNGTNAYVYDKDFCRLTFIISDGTVSDITYVYKNN